MFYVLFMPVIYLVNVPKNNLVFSLHVLRYTFGVHCSHVALQGNGKAADICSHLQKLTVNVVRLL